MMNWKGASFTIGYGQPSAPLYVKLCNAGREVEATGSIAKRRPVQAPRSEKAVCQSVKIRC